MRNWIRSRWLELDEHRVTLIYWIGIALIVGVLSMAGCRVAVEPINPQNPSIHDFYNTLIKAYNIPTPTPSPCVSPKRTVNKYDAIIKKLYLKPTPIPTEIPIVQISPTTVVSPEGALTPAAEPTVAPEAILRLYAPSPAQTWLPTR